MKICHIADIHWRGLTRHDEYKHVFALLFDKLKTVKPDIIFVGGDIFHTKTQNISPEVLECLDWWFKQLAEISHVVVTLGNHDGNLLNDSRQDAITPIIKMLDNSRIALYKQSGNYVDVVDNNFNWSIFSCFDPDGWKNVKPVPNKINIATFHGVVVGSTTDTDYTLKGEVDLKFFDGFDFVLLGDIHKMQYLAHRTCKDGIDKPWIAYCGSTIQQNYAESNEHGFLMWDIRDRDDFDVSFITIENQNRFITLDWQGDIATTLKLAANDLPNARYRIRSIGSTIHQADWRRLTKALKQVKGAVEVVPKVESVVASSVNIDNIKIDDVHDIGDPNVMIKLIRKYAEQQYSDKTLSIVGDKTHEYLKTLVGSSNVARNVKWSIDKLTFANTFAYGDGNSINFSSLQGITGIFAGNTAGKSSIIGTLMYALFNGTDRGSLKNLHVINIRKDDCSATVKLTINGRKHEVTRSSIKHTNGAGYIHAATSLNFTALDTGEQFDGEDRKVTDKRLRSKIGSADDFMLTSLAVQGGMKNFIDGGASQRKAILYRFLDLQIFEQIYELAKRDSTIIKSQLRDMPERDWGAIKRELTTRRDMLNTTISECDVEINRLRESLTALKFELAGLSIDSCISTVDIERQQEHVLKLYDRLSLTETKHTLTVNKIAVAQDIIDKIDNVERTFPLIQHIEREERYAAATIALNEVITELRRFKEQCDVAVKHVAKLDVVPCGDQFPSCRYIRDAHEDKLKLPSLRKLVDDANITLEQRKKLVLSLFDSMSSIKLTRFRRIIDSKRRHVDRLEKLRFILQLAERDMTDVASLLSAGEQQLTDMQLLLRSNDESDRRQLLLTTIANTEKVLARVDVRRTQAIHDVGKAAATLEQIMRDQALYIKITEEWRAYECIMTATAKRAIPSQLLRYFIPVINDEIAKILNGIVGFTITLDVPEDSNAMEVYIDYGDSARLIELASGMEKMIASIAIRVALTNVSSLPKTDMFIIDEGFSELDETNIEACCSLLRSLTRYYRSIIIITHINSMKDVVDNVIDITHNGMDARVIVD